MEMYQCRNLCIFSFEGLFQRSLLLFQHLDLGGLHLKGQITVDPGHRHVVLKNWFIRGFNNGLDSLFQPCQRRSGSIPCPLPGWPSDLSVIKEENTEVEAREGIR